MQQCRHYRKFLATNSGATSFTAPVATVTKPTSNIVEACHSGGRLVPECIKLIFFGNGDANDVFDARLYGWNRVPNDLLELWVPTLLADLTCTLGAGVGVAGSILVVADKFVDTISINDEFVHTADTTNDGTICLMSPAGDLVAHAIVPLFGSELLQLDFDMTTGDPTGGNALYAFLD